MSKQEEVTRFKIGDIIQSPGGNVWKKTGNMEWLCLKGVRTWNTGDKVPQGDNFINNPGSRIINFETYVEQANRLVSEGVN